MGKDLIFAVGEASFELYQQTDDPLHPLTLLSSYRTGNILEMCINLPSYIFVRTSNSLQFADLYAIFENKDIHGRSLKCVDNTACMGGRKDVLLCLSDVLTITRIRLKESGRMAKPYSWHIADIEMVGDEGDSEVE